MGKQIIEALEILNEELKKQATKPLEPVPAQYGDIVLSAIAVSLVGKAVEATIERLKLASGTKYATPHKCKEFMQSYMDGSYSLYECPECGKQVKELPPMVETVKEGG